MFIYSIVFEGYHFFCFDHAFGCFCPKQELFNHYKLQFQLYNQVRNIKTSFFSKMVTFWIIQHLQSKHMSETLRYISITSVPTADLFFQMNRKFEFRGIWQIGANVVVFEWRPAIGHASVVICVWWILYYSWTPSGRITNSYLNRMVVRAERDTNLMSSFIRLKFYFPLLGEVMQVFK